MVSVAATVVQALGAFLDLSVQQQCHFGAGLSYTGEFAGLEWEMVSQVTSLSTSAAWETYFVPRIKPSPSE